MAKRPGEKVALEIKTGKSNLKTNLEKVKNAGFDRIILFATSPAAVAACQRAVESIKRGQSPSIDMLNWLDISKCLISYLFSYLPFEIYHCLKKKT